MRLKWPEGANYFAVDWDGIGYFYIDKPIRCLNGWKGDYVYKKKSYGVPIEIEVCIDGIDWKDTLVKRPMQPKQNPKFTDVKKQLEEL